MLINQIIKKQLQGRKDICFTYNGEKVSIPQIEQLDVPCISVIAQKEVVQVDNFDLSKRYKFTFSKALTLPNEFHNKYNKGIPIPETVLYGTVQYKIDNYTYIEVATRLGVRWFGWVDDVSIISLEEY